MSPAATALPAAALPRATRPLANGVFLARTGDDVIVLDLRSDAYACLAGAGDALVLAGNAVEADLGLLGLLADAGLLGEPPGTPRPSPPARPMRELETPAAGWPLRHAAGMAAAVAAAARLGPSPAIRRLIAALPPAPAPPSDPGRVADLTAGFRRLLPWVPGQGACLYRAFVLLTLLRRAGQDAVWVFGVRTWPFAAHCWLQLGEAVLDDDPERIAPYTPIMAVR